VSLRVFSDPDRTRSFDYGIGRLKDDDDDGDNVEIVDPPDIL